MDWIQALVLAIVEGLTEFLPVSSTGHMIITSAFMGITESEFTKVYIVAIQLGAILSVVVVYFKRFFKDLNFYYKLFVAFIPSAIAGLLLKPYIDMLLENVWVVAISLLLGGFVLVFMDKWFSKNEVSPDDEITYKKAFIIGIFQTIAMIPGVSRSAATIFGGLSKNLSRKVAAEFSFFLAVPTMFAATAKSLFDDRDLLMDANISILIFGNIIAFIVAILAIKFFIGFLNKYGFKIFGYYRIILGIILIALLASGADLTIVD